jgi:HSP20 family protein
MTGPLSTHRPRTFLPSFRRGPLARLREEMEDLFERFWDDEGDGWRTQLLAPPLDLSETDKDVSVRLDLPGVNPKEMDPALDWRRATSPTRSR